MCVLYSKSTFSTRAGSGGRFSEELSSLNFGITPKNFKLAKLLFVDGVKISVFLVETLFASDFLTFTPVRIFWDHWIPRF